MARKKKAGTTPAVAKGPEGWGDIRPRDSVHHYYRGGASLCHQVGLYAGPLEADSGDRGHDDCEPCSSRLAKIGTPA